VDRLGIAVLGVLDQEDHEERHNGRARIDDQLPGIREAEEGASYGPGQDDAEGKEECPGGTYGFRDGMRKLPKEFLPGASWRPMPHPTERCLTTAYLRHSTASWQKAKPQRCPVFMEKAQRFFPPHGSREMSPQGTNRRTGQESTPKGRILAVGAKELGLCFFPFTDAGGKKKDGEFETQVSKVLFDNKFLQEKRHRTLDA
jgi:hypothetical protein